MVRVSFIAKHLRCVEKTNNCLDSLFVFLLLIGHVSPVSKQDLDFSGMYDIVSNDRCVAFEKVSKMALVQFVSITKAARVSGIPITKIYRFVHAGELKLYQKNGTLKINIQDLLKKKSRMKDHELLEPAFMNFISEIKKKESN